MRRAMFLLLLATTAAAPPPPADLVITGGTIYDGSGGKPFAGWVAIIGDRIVNIGTGAPPAARATLDATGEAVAPGFINMLSHAEESLIQDGRAVSDIKQGVTLEVMGEGDSMGPLNPAMKDAALRRERDIQYPITWTTLGDYLSGLERKGISVNVASFVGAATVRVNQLGEDNLQPSAQNLAAMQGLVAQAMNEGALGVGSALIYAPGTYAKTSELTALATAAARCGGMYISHMRSEGDEVLPALDELIEISRASGAPAEIYHFKQAGQANWGKLDAMVAKVEAARARGQRITADMYTYPAAATGLDAAMPTWVQAGGLEQWIARLKDPATRAKVAEEMRHPGVGWSNTLQEAGSAANVLLVGFKNPALKPLTGQTLAAVAKARGKTPEETAIDLVVEDGSRVDTIYFLMTEHNVARETDLPWMSFGSDEAAPAAEGVFLSTNSHPRAYGNFARLLGKYVRLQDQTTLPDAVRRLTSLPATNLGIEARGRLAPGYFADVVVFDPRTIIDNATYAKPAQYATGVRDVFVNGVHVLKGGEPAAAGGGRFVKGPGYRTCAG